MSEIPGLVYSKNTWQSVQVQKYSISALMQTMISEEIWMQSAEM